ncbi:DUF3794 domain-containing protein [Clostridium sp.]|uniref:DUF3794 domain-containing protein n=1 Tax=Clostridium sp. TaxID=1506 RepID=UPI003D6D01F0
MFKQNLCSIPYTTKHKSEPVKPIPEPAKMIQVPVVKGFGEKEELIVSELTISPPNPPVFRIVDIDKEVIISNSKLTLVCIPEGCQSHYNTKVIVDGFIDKNILYKTITDFTDSAVGGPVYQFTTRIPFTTFVEVKTKDPLCKTDKVEILSAVVVCEEDELLDPNDVATDAPDFAITYNTIVERMIVKIKLKITRVEHICLK